MRGEVIRCEPQNGFEMDFHVGESTGLFGEARELAVGVSMVGREADGGP